MKPFPHVCKAWLVGLTVLLTAGWVAAAKVSDVRATKHNLSAAADGSATPSGTVPARTIKASSETQVCVFCHTPHAAENIPKVGGTPGAPLWNRKLSGATYTTYTSTSIEASAAELSSGPGGSSKLCLSCHDGTMAIDKVNVLNGVSSPSIAMTIGGVATAPAYMPAASASTGFTRNLGNNLTNDHPISLTYDSSLAIADGELRSPDGVVVGNRTAGATKPKMPLENNQVQCATCHDPHLNDTLDAKAKFLRMNRLQAVQPIGGSFSETNDTICLACHDKAGTAWAYSAHANSNVATQLYKDAAATLREFPIGTPVWKAGCLNCHDTHTVQGARRLLREGTDSTTSPKAGGGSAIEETCYQCHTTVAGSAVTYTINTANAIPDIKTDFTTVGNKHMPITSSEQLAGGTEAHEIGGVFSDSAEANCANTATPPTGKCGKDLLESRAKLGLDALNNRHAECTDCHNPHRVAKTRKFNDNNATVDAAARGTHKHTDDATDIHTNIASGVLRGSWGVEPSYGSNSFQTMATGFAVKKGDGGTGASELVGSNWVTREYQICLKCHSNYAYADTGNTYPNSAFRPQLGSPGTAANANGHLNFTSYTNQAKEFQAPSSHAVTVGSVSLGFDGGAGINATTTATNSNNHRSWHPVMAPTGRTGRAGNWIAPWNNSGTGGKAGRLGVQTMYCSDCHGSSTGSTASVIPTGGDNGSPWGPHGSSNNFLLKGTWNTGSGEGDNNTLCFKCHNQSSYSGSGGGTGFTALKADGSNQGDGHALHSNRIDTNMKCNFCHVAVPHGWKNRGLLVNLRDVGPEAGQPAGTDVGNGPYTNGPYYRRAYLRIFSFPTNGSWNETRCGGRDAMKSQCETAT